MTVHMVCVILLVFYYCCTVVGVSACLAEGQWAKLRRVKSTAAFGITRASTVLNISDTEGER